MVSSTKYSVVLCAALCRVLRIVYFVYLQASQSISISGLRKLFRPQQSTNRVRGGGERSALARERERTRDLEWIRELASFGTRYALAQAGSVVRLSRGCWVPRTHSLTVSLASSFLSPLSLSSSLSLKIRNAECGTKVSSAYRNRNRLARRRARGCFCLRAKYSYFVQKPTTLQPSCLLLRFSYQKFMSCLGITYPYTESRRGRPWVLKSCAGSYAPVESQ